MALHHIDWQVHTGRWRRYFKGVLIIEGAPPSWHQRLLAACLSAGEHAVASHRSAAELWEMSGWGTDHVEISVPSKLRRPDVVVHRLAAPCPFVATRHRIPVTDPTCTLLDLAAVASDFETEKAIDFALRTGLTHLPLLCERLELRARQGRNGIRRMRRLLDERDSRARPRESPLEVLFARLVRRFGLPEPVPQFEIRDSGGRVIARVDFAYPEQKVAIELQSYAYHHDRIQWEKDQARAGALTSLGWLFYPVTNLQLRDGPEEVFARLDRVLSLRIRK